MTYRYLPLSILLLLDTMPVGRFIEVYNAMLLAGVVRGQPTEALTDRNVRTLLEDTGIVWG